MWKCLHIFISRAHSNYLHKDQNRRPKQRPKQKTEAKTKKRPLDGVIDKHNIYIPHFISEFFEAEANEHEIEDTDFDDYRRRRRRDSKNWLQFFHWIK